MAQQTIVAVVDDLMFQSRIDQHVRALGFAFIAVATETGLKNAVESTPALVIVDLHVRGIEWQVAVPLAKEYALPVLAFGRHTEPALLRDARAAGADRVMARSQLVEDLPQLVSELTNQAISPE